MIVRLANRKMVAVKQDAVFLRRKPHTAWGPVRVQHQVFVVMPGDDKTLILGRITLEMLGIFSNACGKCEQLVGAKQ